MKRQNFRTENLMLGTLTGELTGELTRTTPTGASEGQRP